MVISQKNVMEIKLNYSRVKGSLNQSEQIGDFNYIKLALYVENRY